MTRAQGIAVLGLVAAAQCGSVPAAWARVELALQLGRTFAVDPGYQGAYDQGGFSAAAAALWTWAGRFRFGASAFAADLGNDVEEVVLEDPSGGPPLDYGSVEAGHIGTYGAAWRVDALGPAVGRRFKSFATGSYGVYRLQADQQGSVVGARTALGGTLGAGLDCPMGDRHALALVLAWNRIFDEEVAQSFTNVAVEWRWRW